MEKLQKINKYQEKLGKNKKIIRKPHFPTKYNKNYYKII